jgi:aqualysin 1
VIAGLDWIAANKQLPAVANMSLGGGASSTIDAAVERVIDGGVTVVVAAGNNNRSACNYSPARTPAAITVGATTSTDYRASYSNFGTCLDLFAPGSAITSAWITSDDSTNTISGTSMASPHVAGIAALVLETLENPTPAKVTATIVDGATSNKVLSPGTGSPNKLAYSQPLLSTATQLTKAVSITKITGSRKTFSNRWTATATVTVSEGISGATVTGTFTGTSTTKSCTTSSGVCSMTSDGINNSQSSTTFSVTNVTGSALTYTSPQPPPSLVIFK